MSSNGKPKWAIGRRTEEEKAAGGGRRGRRDTAVGEISSQKFAKAQRVLPGFVRASGDGKKEEAAASVAAGNGMGKEAEKTALA